MSDDARRRLEAQNRERRFRDGLRRRTKNSRHRKMNAHASQRPHFEARRTRLTAGLRGKTALLHNGGLRFRNITSSGYPFRAGSHVLYFAGRYPPGAIVLIGAFGAEVYLHKPDIDEAVWDGAGRPRREYEDQFGVTVRDRTDLEK